MKDLFKGPLRKIEWAKTHIDKIQALVNDFETNDAHKVRTEKNPRTGLLEYSFDTTASLPQDVNLTFGDAVHNLRAALDYVWVAAISEFDPKVNIKELHFPMRETWKNSIDTIESFKQYATAIATPRYATLKNLMGNDIQFHATPDSKLSILNKLDNIDKHRLLLTVFVSTGVQSTRMEGGMFIVENVRILNAPNNMNPGIVAPPEVKGDVKPAVEVFINEPTVTRERLIPTLFKLAECVSDVVNKITQCVIAHRSAP